MKKLPRGIQNITEVLTGGYAYVDKTDLAYQLITSGKHYFMSRPRRFGKSLFLSTLEEILKGNEELFKGCQIYKTDYQWRKFPILHLDFSLIPNQTSVELKQGLQEALEDVASLYGVSISGASLQSQLTRLIKKLAQTGDRVVVLIDEYDQPIISHLKNLDIADENRDILKDFFGTLKGLDAHIEFTFITGVSKFSQVSLFSGPNYLSDLTMDPKYASLMGYTDTELKANFDDHIQHVAKARKLGFDAIIEELKRWYNGYRFSKEEISVYNPYSTLNYLELMHAESFWYRSGTPSFLIELIKKQPISALTLSSSTAFKSTLLDISSFERISIIALMFQTGYLTIQNHDASKDIYHLNFPNKEVRQAFFQSLLDDFAQIEPTEVATRSDELKHALETMQLQTFIEMINTWFAKIPYELSKNAHEGFFHALFQTFIEASDIETYSEVATNKGRIDLVLELDHLIYVMELKLDQSAEIALEQAQIKQYEQKFAQTGKEVVVVGINFSTKSRDITDWQHYQTLACQ